MTLTARNLVFILLLLCVLGCKKSNPNNAGNPITYPAATGMTVVNGNNQFGYVGHPMDTIVIKVSISNAADSSRYAYLYHSTGTQDLFNILGEHYSSGAVYVQALWTPGAGDSAPVVTFYSYIGCSIPFNGQPTGCKTLDSVKISAVIRKPWVNYFSAQGALTDLQFPDANHAIATGDQAGIVRSADGGKTWTIGPPARTANDGQMMAFAGPDTGLMVVTNNYAMITTDGGQTYTQPNWNAAFVGDRSSAAYYMASRNVIYTVGWHGQIAKTIDGGITWMQKGFTFLNNFAALTAIGKDTLYTVGDVGKIARSTDAGNTWQVQAIQLNNYLDCVYFINSNFGFAGGQYGALIRTTDGGNHWTIINTGLRFPVITIRFFTSLHGFIVTSGGEVAESTDGGLTWAKRNTDNYGAAELVRAIVKDPTIIYGIQQTNIYTYDLTQP